MNARNLIILLILISIKANAQFTATKIKPKNLKSDVIQYIAVSPQGQLYILNENRFARIEKGKAKYSNQEIPETKEDVFGRRIERNIHQIKNGELLISLPKQKQVLRTDFNSYKEQAWPDSSLMAFIDGGEHLGYFGFIQFDEYGASIQNGFHYANGVTQPLPNLSQNINDPIAMKEEFEQVYSVMRSIAFPNFSYIKNDSIHTFLPDGMESKKLLSPFRLENNFEVNKIENFVVCTNRNYDLQIFKFDHVQNGYKETAFIPNTYQLETAPGSNRKRPQFDTPIHVADGELFVSLPDPDTKRVINAKGETHPIDFSGELWIHNIGPIGDYFYLPKTQSLVNLKTKKRTNIKGLPSNVKIRRGVLYSSSIWLATDQGLFKIDL